MFYLLVHSETTGNTLKFLMLPNAVLLLEIKQLDLLNLILKASQPESRPLPLTEDEML